jgi:hypothetical protein
VVAKTSAGNNVVDIYDTEVINVSTAINERLLNRARPHMPCPDVHPFPKLGTEPDTESTSDKTPRVSAQGVSVNLKASCCHET